MKTLLWIGNPFFCPQVESLLSLDTADCGVTREPLWGDAEWRVVHYIPAENELLGWKDCVRLAGTEPYLLVVGDNSRPPFVLGVENFPCRTVFYAVDTHIHSWMPWYAQAFDACLISLKDHIAAFRGKRLEERRLWWFPPYAPDGYEWATTFPQDGPLWDCLFVGTVDPIKLPVRQQFVARLKELVPALELKYDYFPRFYPRTRVAVNICEQGDLNFRVFESMGCGTALVTPRVGHGLSELFTPDRHCRMFDFPALEQSENLPPETLSRIGAEAAEKAAPLIHELLADEPRRAAMARAGWEEINRAHRAGHRASAFLERLRTLEPDLPAKRMAEAAAIRRHFLRFPYLLWSESLTDVPLKAAYLRASQGVY